MSQAALLSSELNPLDQFSAYVFEILNCNDYNSVNLTLETLSQVHFDKLRTGRVRQELSKLDRYDEKENIFSDREKLFVKTYVDILRTKQSLGLDVAEENTRGTLLDVQ
jgi:hypothetical protein